MTWDNVNPAKALRSEAKWLAQRKLTGDPLRQATGFIGDARRTEAQLRSLMDRLASLPDVERDGPTRGKGSYATMEQVRDAHKAGTSMRELAVTHGVNPRTIARWITAVNERSAGK